MSDEIIINFPHTIPWSAQEGFLRGWLHGFLRHPHVQNPYQQRWRRVAWDAGRDEGRRVRKRWRQRTWSNGQIRIPD